MENKYHHDNPAEQTPQGDESSLEATLARMKAQFEGLRTGYDELLELAAQPDKKEQLEALLEDLTYEALSENEEFTTNAASMRSGKLSKDQQTAVRDRQRELFTLYRQALIREAGLSDEATQNDIDASKQHVREIIEQHLDTDEADPMEILHELGILQRDDDNRETFTYPEGLFPESTDEKWQTYLETVRRHLKIGREVRHGMASQKDLADADTVRRMAHNAVTRDVHEILGLSNLPDSEWDFEKTRNLLAKMRDSRFPTVETAEKFMTEKALVEGVMGARAVQALVTRLSDLHK